MWGLPDAAVGPHTARTWSWGIMETIEWRAPEGYGDELRAVGRLGDKTWGVLALARERFRRPFSPVDLDVVRAVAPAVALALRRFVSTTQVPAGSAAGSGPGTALYDDA